MKNTLLAVALVSLGIVSAEAAVIPANAGFGANLSDGTTSNNDSITVGFPSQPGFSTLSQFNDGGGADDPIDTASIISPSTGANFFYRFLLQYNYPGANTANSLRFTIYDPGTNAANALAINAVRNQVFEADIYNDPNTPGYIKQNIDNLKGLVFVPRAATGATVFLSNLSVSNATATITDMSFVGDGVGATSFFFGATGLSDGFTLEGVFRFTGQSGKDAGFDVYAAVPEPATICFGAALVGGLGLLEVRRRRQV